MCRTIIHAVVAFMFLTGGIVSCHAEEKERQALFEILGGEPLRAEMFSETFLRQVPLAQVQDIISQLRSTAGAPVTVEEKGDRYIVKTESHEIPAAIVLDASGKISGLHFQSAVGTGQSLEHILAEIEKLPGKTAYLIMKDGQALHKHNAQVPMAVGSTFKLAILARLAEKIDQGEARWADIITLKANQISAPTGIFQTLPVGSPVTLHTLAAFMISISDNTATDALLDFVGRDAVASKLGTDFVLKTRELFILEANTGLRERYLAGDKSEKAKLVEELGSHPLPQAKELRGRPYYEGVEYYTSLQTLCSLMAEVSGLDVMSINPGFANAADWKRIAYKGGSEVGVLNFTTELTGEDGNPICVAMSWNDRQALDETKAHSLYASLISRMASGKLSD